MDRLQSLIKSMDDSNVILYCIITNNSAAEGLNLGFFYRHNAKKSLKFLEKFMFYGRDGDGSVITYCNISM